MDDGPAHLLYHLGFTATDGVDRLPVDDDPIRQHAGVLRCVQTYFPVNYAVDEATIVFRTAGGTKLSAVFVDSAVAFEVDGYDTDTGTAWSVVIKGHAAEIPMQELLDDLAFPLFSWTPTPKPRFVRVVPDEITGRLFHVVQRRPPPTG